jgi:two-component system, OmpR family, sensor histidine kinase KdpD
VLVCVGPSPTSARIVRATKRLASSLGAEWLAVAVDPGGERRQSLAAKEQTSRNLRLAEQLGAETHTLVGRNVAEALLDFAQLRNVTKVVVGKTAQPRWKQWLAGTVVDQLLAKGGDVDIYIVSGEGDAPAPARAKSPAKEVPWHDYARAGAITFGCAALAWIARRTELADANIVMIFLAGVALVAARWGRGPAVAAAVTSVLVFDFFFVPPRLTFAVSDTQYLLTFAVMLGIGLLISELTSRLQSQLRASQQHEQRTSQLYRMTRQLSELSGSEFLAKTACRQLKEIFDGEVVLYLREPSGSLLLRSGDETEIAKRPINTVVAQWVATNGKVAGAGTDTLPNATAVFVPLAGSQEIVGALGVRPREAGRFLDPEQIRLLETCGSLVALSIERDRSVLKANEAELQVCEEQLRNSLLSSVSHDLRTPLATIAGAASSILEQPHQPQGELLQSIVDESRRLGRLVENLLDMARLDSGSMNVNRQWHVLEEIVGIALRSLSHEISRHNVRVSIPADFPLLNVDGLLIEQLLCNLLENAARYTPANSTIEITAHEANSGVAISVADNGPGLPEGSESAVFEKFFRGASIAPDGRRGVGLGLAICQAIAAAHGGTIAARIRPQGGAEFIVRLPCNETPPRIDIESAVAAATA